MFSLFKGYSSNGCAPPTTDWLTGGAGGLEHIRPELQISRGRIFLTTSIMELTQC
jgi:hypothetical protein